MKVGDRVIYKYGGLGRTYASFLGSRKWPDGAKAFVSKINMNGLPNGLPHQVRITQPNTTENLWCWSDEIEIDTEWYREEKLKEIGILCEAEIPQKSGII